jgi:nitric-oxide synthase, bacterial
MDAVSPVSGGGAAKDGVPGHRDQPTEHWDPMAPADSLAAEDFLRRCYLDNARLGPVEPRLTIVRAQIAATGTYVHTTEELACGAKLAWRNANRCIGRLYWRSLVVLDRGGGPIPGRFPALPTRP